LLITQLTGETNWVFDELAHMGVAAKEGHRSKCEAYVWLLLLLLRLDLCCRLARRQFALLESPTV